MRTMDKHKLVAIWFAIGFFAVLITLAIVSAAKAANVYCPLTGPCHGGSGPDNIYPTAGTTQVIAYQGNDMVFAASASTVIWLGDGSDRAEGGGGSDTIYGGPGADGIYGGLGVDTIRGEGGSDLWLYGDAGNDTIYSNNCDTGEPVNGGADYDSAHVDSGDNVSSVENRANYLCS